MGGRLCVSVLDAGIEVGLVHTGRQIAREVWGCADGQRIPVDAATARLRRSVGVSDRFAGWYLRGSCKGFRGPQVSALTLTV